MKPVGRIVVVAIVVAVFAGVFLFMKRIETLGNRAQQEFAVEQLKQEVIVQHACSKDFFSSCVNISPEVCAKELLATWDKCAADTSNLANPNDPVVIECSMAAYTAKYPLSQRKSDPTCLEPPPLDNEKMKKELEERIAKMLK